MAFILLQKYQTRGADMPPHCQRSDSDSALIEDPVHCGDQQVQEVRRAAQETFYQFSCKHGEHKEYDVHTILEIQLLFHKISNLDFEPVNLKIIIKCQSCIHFKPFHHCKTQTIRKVNLLIIVFLKKHNSFIPVHLNDRFDDQQFAAQNIFQLFNCFDLAYPFYNAINIFDDNISASDEPCTALNLFFKVHFRSCVVLISCVAQRYEKAGIKINAHLLSPVIPLTEIAFFRTERTDYLEQRVCHYLFFMSSDIFHDSFFYCFFQ